MSNQPRPFDAAKLPSEATMRNVPDLRDAVEGWRTWRVARALPAFGNPPKLESVTSGRLFDHGYWTPRRAARAVCPKYVERLEDMPENHVATLGCRCGFYSAKSLEHLAEIGYLNYGQDGNYVAVTGQVACWGTVTEGTLGWRSEFCYPIRLYVPLDAARLIKPLRAAYGVPVVPKMMLNELLNEEN
jgi:hypothetical protein